MITDERPLYYQPKHLFATGFIITSLLLMIISLFWPAWLELTAIQGPVSMSLNSCTDCQHSRKDWSWQCFEQYHCNIMHDDELCEYFDSGYRITVTYETMEFLAILFNGMLLGRYLSFILGRDYGSATLVRLLSVLIFVFHSSGLIIFFVVQNPSFEDNCEEPRRHDELPSQCVQDGPLIALSAVMMQLLVMFQVNYAFSFRDLTRDNGVRLCIHRVYCISSKVWMWGILVLQLVIYLLTVLSLTSMDWIQRSSQIEKLSGGLLRCTDCPIGSAVSV